MAQIKNIFTKSKMNLDLDERLVPKGEYRKAQNILITNSEDSDVGAIENIRGNELIDNITTTGSKGATVIGSYADNENQRLFWFVTTFEGNQTDDINKNTRATSDDDCRIVYKQLPDSNARTIVSGKFLNLSKNHRITGINVIGDYIYFTDNYNQPRGFNVNIAIGDPTYYDCEEKISTAKVAPFLPPFLNNSNLASSNANKGDGVTLSTTDPNSGGTRSDYMREKFIRFAYRYKFEDNSYSIISPFTQHVFKPLNAGKLQYTSGRNSTANEPKVNISSQSVAREGELNIMQNAYDRVVMRIPIPTVANNSGHTYVTEFETNDNYVSASTYSNELKIKEIEILLKEAGSAAIKLVDIINMDSAANESPSPFGVYKVTPKTNRNYYRQTIEYVYKSKEPFKVLPEKQLIRVGDNAPVRAQAQEVTGNRLIYGNITLGYSLPTDVDNKKGVKFVVSSGPKGNTEHNSSIGHFYHNIEQYKYHNIKQRRTYQVGIVLSDKYGRQSPVILSTHKINNLSDTHTVQGLVTDLSDEFNSGYSWSSLQEAFGQALNVEFLDSYFVNSDITHIPNGTATPSTRPNGWYSWRLVVKQTEQDYYNVYTQHPMNNWSIGGTTKTVFLDADLTGGNAGNRVYRDQIIKGSFSTDSQSRSWFALTNDNINKVPRSIKESDETREGVSGSDVQIYPKVIQVGSHTVANNASNWHDSTYSHADQGYIPVLSIGNATDQGLSSLSNAKKQSDLNDQSTVKDSIFPDKVRVYRFIAESNKNPIVAEIPNLYNEPVNVYGQHAVSPSWTNSSPSNTPATMIRTSNNLNTDTPFGYPETIRLGLTVFETKPFESKLDIYYETSTCGLVKDLNEHCEHASVAPSAAQIEESFQVETYTTDDNASIKEEALSGAQIGELKSTADTTNDNNAVITGFALLGATNNNNDGVDINKFSIALEDNKSYVKISSVQTTNANAQNAGVSTEVQLGYTELKAMTVNQSLSGTTMPAAFNSNGYYRVYMYGTPPAVNNNVMTKIHRIVQVTNNVITEVTTPTTNNPTGNIVPRHMLKTNDVFAFYNDSRDVYTLTIRATQTGAISTTSTITVNITNSIPLVYPQSMTMPSIAGNGAGYKLSPNAYAYNGSADVNNRNFGMTATALTGTHASHFELSQITGGGQWRLVTKSTFNFNSVFGTPSNGVYPGSNIQLGWNVTDNGNATSTLGNVLTITPVEVVTVQGYFDSDQNTACTQAQTQSNSTFYVIKHNGIMPTSTQLNTGNKVYTNSALTLVAAPGWLVVQASGGNYQPYQIGSNGVVSSLGSTCTIV